MRSTPPSTTSLHRLSTFSVSPNSTLVINACTRFVASWFAVSPPNHTGGVVDSSSDELSLALTVSTFGALSSSDELTCAMVIFVGVGWQWLVEKLTPCRLRRDDRLGNSVTSALSGRSPKASTRRPLRQFCHKRPKRSVAESQYETTA